MAGYVVDVTPRADADLHGLSSDVAVRVSKKMRLLREDPRPHGDTIERLEGLDPATYRLRIGDYRAVFRVEGATTRVLRVIHRSRLGRALRDLV